MTEKLLRLTARLSGSYKINKFSECLYRVSKTKKKRAETSAGVIQPNEKPIPFPLKGIRNTTEPHHSSNQRRMIPIPPLVGSPTLEFLGPAGILLIAKLFAALQTCPFSRRMFPASLGPKTNSKTDLEPSTSIFDHPVGCNQGGPDAWRR